MNKIEMLQQLVSQNPDNALYHYTLGNEYVKQKQWALAIAPLRQAIQLDPRFTAAYRELGKALAATGQTQEAITVYEKGIGVGESTGDLQTVKEIRVFLNRLLALR